MLSKQRARLALLLAVVLVFGMPVSSAVVAASEHAKLIPSDGAAQDHFGYSVAVSGDTIVAGAYTDDDRGPNSGSAYVFEPDGSGGYVEVKLVASDGAQYDFFGVSVAVSDDKIVVGAPKDGDGGVWSGSAYVYASDGFGGYVETKLTASDADADDHFGIAVAVAGEIVVVGAQYGDGETLSDTGAVYVFEPDGSGGYNETKLTASDAAQWDAFGAAVAIDGATIVVGTDRQGPGVAYVYEPAGSGGYDETKLAAADGAAGDKFGTSVAVSGGTVVVGARWNAHAGTNAGATYVYEPYGAGDYHETKLTASDAAQWDAFGAAVAIDGATIVVGTDRQGPGVAYVYEPASSGSYAETKLTASDAVIGDRFGFSVAVAGGAAVVGAPGYGDPDDRDLPGSAYVFSLAEVATSAVVEALDELLSDLDPGSDATEFVEDAITNAEKALDKFDDGKTGPALGKLAKAVKDLEDAVEEDPNLDLDEVIATLTAAARAAALADVDEARAIDPGSKKVADAEELMTEGDALRDAGDYSGAIKKYRKAADKVKGLLP